MKYATKVKMNPKLEKERLAVCWYCGERPRKNKDSLFCEECEEIKKKEIVRPGCENAQRPEFGKGAKGLGV